MQGRVKGRLRNADEIKSVPKLSHVSVLNSLDSRQAIENKVDQVFTYFDSLRNADEIKPVPQLRRASVIDMRQNMAEKVKQVYTYFDKLISDDDHPTFDLLIDLLDIPEYLQDDVKSGLNLAFKYLREERFQLACDEFNKVANKTKESESDFTKLCAAICFSRIARIAKQQMTKVTSVESSEQEKAEAFVLSLGVAWEGYYEAVKILYSLDVDVEKELRNFSDLASDIVALQSKSLILKHQAEAKDKLISSCVADLIKLLAVEERFSRQENINLIFDALKSFDGSAVFMNNMAKSVMTMSFKFKCNMLLLSALNFIWEINVRTKSLFAEESQIKVFSELLDHYEMHAHHDKERLLQLRKNIYVLAQQQKCSLFQLQKLKDKYCKSLFSCAQEDKKEASNFYTRVVDELKDPRGYFKLAELVRDNPSQAVEFEIKALSLSFEQFNDKMLDEAITLLIKRLSSSSAEDTNNDYIITNICNLYMNAASLKETPAADKIFFALINYAQTWMKSNINNVTRTMLINIASHLFIFPCEKSESLLLLIKDYIVRRGDDGMIKRVYLTLLESPKISYLEKLKYIEEAKKFFPDDESVLMREEAIKYVRKICEIPQGMQAIFDFSSRSLLGASSPIFQNGVEQWLNCYLLDESFDHKPIFEFLIKELHTSKNGLARFAKEKLLLKLVEEAENPHAKRILYLFNYLEGPESKKLHGEDLAVFHAIRGQLDVDKAIPKRNMDKVRQVARYDNLYALSRVAQDYEKHQLPIFAAIYYMKIYLLTKDEKRAAKRFQLANNTVHQLHLDAAKYLFVGRQEDDPVACISALAADLFLNSNIEKLIFDEYFYTDEIIEAALTQSIAQREVKDLNQPKVKDLKQREVKDLNTKEKVVKKVFEYGNLFKTHFEELGVLGVRAGKSRLQQIAKILDEAPEYQITLPSGLSQLSLFGGTTTAAAEQKPLKLGLL